ncbi:hypothetical protein N0V88_000417 [Collariella sp. IMI 366227]|nr:hypothetical protein N0V88_000417 [Collariella sp. IMI 366227]
MPPKTPKGNSGGEDGDGRKQPTAQEAFLFYSIIKNMKGKPDVDWTGVATDAGFKNAETAKVRYGQIKRKLGLDTNTTPSKAAQAKDDDASGANDDAGAGPSALPSTPTGTRLKKAATGAGVRKRANTGSTTAKRIAASTGRGRKTKAALAKLENEQEDTDNNNNNLINMDTFNTTGGDTAMPDFTTSPAKTTNKGKGLDITTTIPTGTTTTTSTSIPYLLEFNTFPLTIPTDVLERRAILIPINGDWIASPVPASIHASWIDNLPGEIQNRFFVQSQGRILPSTTFGGMGSDMGGDMGCGMCGDMGGDMGGVVDEDANGAAAQLINETLIAGGGNGSAAARMVVDEMHGLPSSGMVAGTMGYTMGNAADEDGVVHQATGGYYTFGEMDEQEQRDAALPLSASRLFPL